MAIIVALIAIITSVDLRAESPANPQVHSIIELIHNSLLVSAAPVASSAVTLLPIMLQLEDIELDTLSASKEVYKPTFLREPPLRRFDIEEQLGGDFGGITPQNYLQAMELDTNLQFLQNNYYVDSVLINDPYMFSEDDYLQIRKQYITNEIRDSLANTYDLKKALTGNDLTKMLSAATGLTIPLPPNPVLNLFGKPTVNINVQGELNLRLGWRWDSQSLGSVSQFGQTQSSPVFNQDIKLIISGGIGDKLKLSTDWNTRRFSEMGNKFKIGYEGEDDDIIKLIEIGNVSLPTQSSLISGSEALFGVRADFQFGPVFLKTIASQKRGQKKTMNVTGGSSKTPFSIHPYDYAKNHFFLDTAYFEIYEDYFKNSTPVIPNTPIAAQNRIKEIEVWEASADPLNNPISAKSVAYANLPARKDGERYPTTIKASMAVAGEVERGNFVRIDSSRYYIDRNLGTLTIYNLRNDRYYAVAYRTEGLTTEKEDDNYYGTFSSDPTVGTNDTLVLKLIYRPNLQPGFKTLWNRQMKNVYSINATNVNASETKLGIWYYNSTSDSIDVLPDAADKLVTIFKVDQTNSAGTAPGDGKFDLRAPFFDTYRGEITFPSRRPFDDGIRDYFQKLGTPQLADKYVYKDVYDTTYEVARLNTSRDKFVISGEVTGNASNRISVGAFNLPQNSVKVYLDGSTLTENVDYTVDYQSGIVTLMNTRATLPNANVRIEYEAQDVFNVSTKTLLGLRADYELFKTRTSSTNLGFTIMHYSQSAVQYRARLGDEPIANTMMGFDLKTNLEMPWVTKALDFLPFYDTKAKSSLALQGEWAIVMPTPNKCYSDVSSDNGAAVAYIDDFESSQRYISLGISATQWTQASPPNDSSIALDAWDRSLYRAKTMWYQYSYPRIPVKDVYPDRETTSGSSNLSALYVKFDPSIRGIYNMNAEYLDVTNPEFSEANAFWENPLNKPKIWGGFQRLLSSFNTNFDSDNIEYVDITMSVEQWEPGATKMYIDLGQISEDIIPNGSLDTEDGITEANPVPNNIIDSGEDLGIDALSDDQERDTYPYPLNLEADPARDNYRFDFYKDDDDRTEYDFAAFNNYQGNATVSESGRYPDTEILNTANGQSLSTADGYFTYEVNLEPNATNNPQIVGGNPEKGYYVWRIPIRKPNSTVGSPLFSNVQYVRVRFQGGVFKGTIVDWKLLGSYWKRNNNIQSNVAEDDSVMSVSFVNKEENSKAPDYYTMPPGVKAPRSMNSDANKEVDLNEQSLTIGVTNLRHGEERLAVRFPGTYDYFYYKRLKYFIHGDGSMPESGTTPKAYSIFRFGIDSSNYYEYRKPLYRGWQSVDIELAKLTAVKQLRDSLGTFQRMEFPVEDDAGAYYAVRGNPVLTRVQFVGFGISNTADQYPNELTTTMWVDELRLLSPENSADWGAVASADLKLADLGNIKAAINYSQPNFHTLEEQYGTRARTTDWSVSANANLEKFAPSAMREMKIPISYSHTEALQKPQYMTNSDVEVEQAAQAVYKNAILSGQSDAEAKALANAERRRSETVRVTNTFAIQGFKFGIPIRHWLVRETINKLVLNYSQSQEWERSPSVAERMYWLWRFQAQYSLAIPSILTLKPLGWVEDDAAVVGLYNAWKLNFLPNNFSTSLSMTRSRTTEQNRYLSVPSPVIRNFTAERQAQFNWRISESGLLSPSLDYNFTTMSSLVPFEVDEFGMQRSGSELSKLILFNNGILDLGTDMTHTQTVTLNITPQLPFGQNYSRMIDMSGTYTTSFNWNNPMQNDPALTDVAKSASFANTIRFKVGIKMKSIGDKLFGVGLKPNQPKGGKSKLDQPADSLKLKTSNGSSFLSTVGDVVKFIFFDYDKIDLSFNQTNGAQNTGVYGNTGFTNFWRSFAGQDNRNYFGPSAAYQLGLISNPHGDFRIVSSDKFPFFGFKTSAGKRPANGVYQDNFTQKTTMEAKTTRPLWKGATLDLTWNTDLGYNRNQTVVADSFGIPDFSNILATESFSRTYLSMPSFFGINIFHNDAENIIDIYNKESAKIDADPTTDSLQKNRQKLLALSDAFHDGLEAFSIFGGKAGKFLPAMNWKINWEGIEKWALWGNWVKKATFEHAYTSKYTESAQVTDNGKVIQQQQVQSGFQPLIGLNFTMNEKKTGGLITAQFRWNSTNNYSITTANRATISRQSSEEIQIQAGYTMDGFEFPLFGIILKNELEFSCLMSYKMNKTSTYDITALNNPDAGRTLDGNTQVIVEPRATYSISNAVRASAFVRYEGTFNEGAGTPGFTTIQVGFDLRVSLAGGR